MTPVIYDYNDCVAILQQFIEKQITVWKVHVESIHIDYFLDER